MTITMAADYLVEIIPPTETDGAARADDLLAADAFLFLVACLLS